MTEFNTLPILDELAPDDRLACTDASAGRNLKQLPVGALLETLIQQLGNHSPLVAAATAPDPTKHEIWFQLDILSLQG